MNWLWSALGFDRIYASKILDFEELNLLNKLYEHAYDELNHILVRLYHYCDSVKSLWYCDYWKINKTDEMTTYLKEEINKYDLEHHLNINIDLSYDEVKIKLLESCEKYLCDYFEEQDVIELELKLGIASMNIFKK